MYKQPILEIPPEIQAGLRTGLFKITNGSIVRWTENGRIYKHLQEVVDLPSPEIAKALVARRLAGGTTKQYALIVAGGGAVLVGSAYVANYLKKKRVAARAVAAEKMPECVARFESSLRTYVEAGRSGSLDAAIVDELIVDLDEVKAFMEEGNEVLISLDTLVPLFDLVIAHTPRLAAAYEVDLHALDEVDSERNVVTVLRRHLQLQKEILADAA